MLEHKDGNDCCDTEGTGTRKYEGESKGKKPSFHQVSNPSQLSFYSYLGRLELQSLVGDQKVN